MSFLCITHCKDIKIFVTSVIFFNRYLFFFVKKHLFFRIKSIKFSRNNVEALSLAFLFDCPSDSDMKHLRGFVTSVFGYRKYRNVRFIGNK